MPKLGELSEPCLDCFQQKHFKKIKRAGYAQILQISHANL